MTLPVHASGVSDAFHRLHNRLAELRPLRHSDVRHFSTRVRSVLVVASSSRGGSSMVTEMLRTSRALLHLQAEINPFLRLAGLGFPDSGTDSDRLDASHAVTLDPAARELLDEELARDAGTVADIPDPEQFSLDVAWRLAVQWPELSLDPLAVAGQVRHALGGARAWDPAAVTVTVLRELRRQGVRISPWYYDLPKGLLHPKVFGAPSARAPGGFLVEEPPFVVARPWRRAGPADLRDRTLVIKTPSNAYRLDFLRALFPHARLRVLHLTRNPAAAVNGLYDGWLHNGFHAHRMATPLTISDYVERCPDNRWWWKFDLPPGWQRYTAAPLPEVCAYQWRSSHQAVLDDLDRTRTDSITLRFEDLIGGADRRIAAFERLSDWLGIPVEGAFRHAVHHGIAPVVATARPRAGRWQDRAAMIERILDAPTLQVADRLGYAGPDDWI
ncbi:sulfotransferase [Streptomyces sp. NPDC023723]|uniref:sulfotransferase n=1 Tax=Streptomyces sp. NPDC023723 TaxID=3154323 RepID=UPI0033E3833F